ncbi:MAG: SPOR domain-containing protein [Bacteroidota bacterium]
MTKALDYLIIVVVALFIIILLVIGFRSCGNLFTKEDNNSKLKNEVTMGEDDDASTTSGEDTLTFDSEGIDPDMIDSLGSAVEEELAESTTFDEEPIAYGSESSITEENNSASNAEENNSTSENRSTASVSNSGPTFFVISGSFLMEDNANTEVSRLKSLGYPAEVLEFAKSEYYTVCVKRFDSRSDADAFKAEILSDKGIKSYVLKQRFK